MRFWWMIVVLVSCKAKTAEQRYADFINDGKNGITQVKRMGKTIITIRYLPAEYDLAMAKKKNEHVSLADREGFYYFNVKIEDSSFMKKDKERAVYLSFDIQNDFFLSENNRLSAPAFCQKIENGLTYINEYIVAFEKSNTVNKDFSFVYKDKLFGIGEQSFVYKQENIRRIPKISIN